MPTTSSAVPNDLKETDLLRAAFRDLHAARLHGFALLVTRGDRARAAQAAANAMAAGTLRAAELRHPERAAAWLRREVLDELRRTRATSHLTLAERRAALRDIGAAEPVIAAVGELTQERRAALVAGVIERFALTDLATILDTNLPGARRTLQGARREYLAAAQHSMHGQPDDVVADGALAARINQIAAVAVGPRQIEP